MTWLRLAVLSARVVHTGSRSGSPVRNLRHGTGINFGIDGLKWLDLCVELAVLMLCWWS